jgi:hypothetical protein
MAVAIATVTDPKQKRKLTKALSVVQELNKQMKTAAYVPSIRPGDWMIRVTKKNDDGTTSTVYREHAQSAAWIQPFKKLRRKEADGMVMPVDVQKKYEVARKYYSGNEYKFEVREVTKENAKNLDLTAIERAVLQMEGKIDPKAADALLDELFDMNISNWRKQSLDIPGYSTDFVRADLDYVHQASGTIERIAHSQDLATAWANIDTLPAGSGGLTGNSIKKFWENYANWVESPSHPFQSLKTFSFVTHLGLNPKSGLVQFFSAPLTIIPNSSLIFGTSNTMSKIMPSVIRAVGTIQIDPDMKLAGLYSKIQTLAKNPEEARMLLRAEREGFLGATLAKAMSGTNFSETVGGADARTINTAINGIGSMISFAETAQKAGLYIAAYRLAKEQPQVIVNNLKKNFKGDKIARTVLDAQGTKDFPHLLAKFAVEEGMLVTSIENQSEIMRGNFMGGFGSLATQFLNYPLKAIGNIIDNAVNRGPKGKLAAAYALTLLWSAAGAAGLPFAEDLFDFASWFAEKFMKKDINFDMDTRNVIDALTGIEGSGEVFMRGPLRMTGADLSASLGLGNILPNFGKPFAETAMGAPYAALTNMGKAVMGAAGMGADASKYNGALDAFLQNAPVAGVRNAYQGMFAWPREGIVKQRGGNTVMPSDISFGEAAMKTVGITPTSVTKERENQYYLGQVRGSYYNRADEQYYRMVNAVALSLDYKNAGRLELSAEEDKIVKDASTKYGKMTGRPINTKQLIKDVGATIDRVGMAKLRSIKDPLLLKQLVENQQINRGAEQ